MKRLRVLICSLGVCALALALAAGSSLLVPATAQAINCYCPFAWSTLQEWGAGSSCAAAIDDFEANAQANAEFTCVEGGSWCCATEAPIHGACYFSQSLWRVDGTMRYKCAKCPPPL